MSDEKLYRVAPAAELIFRDESGEATVEGLVVPYDKWSEVDSVIEGHFLERFAAGSLKKTFAEGMRRAKGYFEHGHSRMFDRTPIMDVTETWETPRGPMFRATLLRGLPEWMVDGVRRGLYGVSLGATPIKVDQVYSPRRSAHNPEGIEERTYRELRATDISLTPQPHYTEAVAVMRSITDEVKTQEIVEALAAQPGKFLHLLREVQEAEPPHSEPDAPEPDVPTPPDDPEQTEEVAPEETPNEPETPDYSEDVEASRDTQPPTKNYLADESEEEWRL